MNAIASLTLQQVIHSQILEVFVVWSEFPKLSEVYRELFMSTFRSTYPQSKEEMYVKLLDLLQSYVDVTGEDHPLSEVVGDNSCFEQLVTTEREKDHVNTHWIEAGDRLLATLRSVRSQDADKYSLDLALHSGTSGS